MNNKPAVTSVIFGFLSLLFSHIVHFDLLTWVCIIIGGVSGVGGLIQGLIMKQERMMALIGLLLSLYVLISMSGL